MAATLSAKQALQQRARELGFDDCRCTTADPPAHAARFQRWLDAGRHGEMGYLARNAHKRIDPSQVLAHARTIITLAASYIPPASFAPAEPGVIGEIARYARFSDYHNVLGRRLKSLAAFLDSLVPDVRSLWYADTGPLLERDLAERAGIGFIGKHTNLISRKLGNWIFLSELITTLELEPDAPEKNHCGSCRRCLDACPTAAITAPFQLDARRCISYLTIELKGSIPEELRPAIGQRIYGCDDCLAVCPWNRFAREGAIMRHHYRSDLAAPVLLPLLALDEAGFQRRFAGTPMQRAKRRGLLRNVCVALGNSRDRQALPALERAALDPEPLIAEHARWAVEKINQNP
ncbi:MAG: tRNA epoxyqueuosine(34) reductase QueG [Limisphaerales bacterium]